MTRLQGSLSLSSKDWWKIFIVDVIAVISASKFEQFTQQASQCFKEVPSVKVRYTPKPTNCVPLKAYPSVYPSIDNDG